MDILYGSSWFSDSGPVPMNDWSRDYITLCLFKRKAIQLFDYSDFITKIDASNQEFERSHHRLEDPQTSYAAWAAYSESVCQKSRGVLYGDLYNGGPPSEEDSGNSQRFVERREFFATLGSVEELKDFMFNMKQVLHSILSGSASAGFLNFSVSDEFRSSLLRAVESRNWEEVESMVMPIAAALPRQAAIYDAFIVLLSLLLSAIFQYLMALVDKGGTKTHSSGSREFRSRYISIVLFQGAYIWIKFREVAPPSLQKPSRGLRRKSYVMDSGKKMYYGNFEPRFKPPGSDNFIYVGLFEEEEDARIIYQILAFYYGRQVPGELPLLDGSTFPIPCMPEEEQWLDPKSKKEWAKDKAKVVFDEYKGALIDSINAWLFDLQEVEASGDISNTLPPDAGAGCDGQPVPLGIQSDGLDAPVSLSSFSPNVEPGMQVHVADDSRNDRAAAAGVGVNDEALLETPLEVSMDSSFRACHWISQEVEPTGGIPNGHPPDVCGRCDGQPVPLGNESDGLDVPVSPSNFSPNVDPGMQVHVADDSCNDHAAAAGARVSDEPPLELHIQHHALEENQAINVNRDDLSVLRLVKELQRQQQLQQFQLQQQESRIQQLESQIQQLESRNQQLESRNQQQGSQISELECNKQLQELHNHQQKSRISELEVEVELLRSTEPARKRYCVGLSLRHNSVN